MKCRIGAARVAGLGSLAVLLTAYASVALASSQLAPGYDLFFTRSGTEYNFMGTGGLGLVEFEGNPLGSFDFGGSIGVESTGDVDTIVRRLATANGPSETIPIELVALSLRSIDLIDIGNGPETIFVVLNADQGDSEMTIDFQAEGDPHGTFDSSLHFTFDVSGSVSGFIVTVEKTFVSNNEPWGHQAIGGIQIAGVNIFTNGSDTTEDFHPKGLVVEDNGNGKHVAALQMAIIPTLSEWGLILFWLLLLAAGARFVVQRQLAMAHATAGRVVLSGRSFDPALYGKVLMATVAVAVVAVALTPLAGVSVSGLDVAGVLVSCVVLAYTIHLWLTPRP
jgi:hypothetical protein